MTTNRRSFVKTALGAAAMAPAVAAAQAQGPRDWSEQNPVRYPDADIVVLDKRFAKYKLGGTSIHRLYTGMLWAEGPAWNGVGKIFGVQRHSERPADALAGRRRSREHVSESIEQLEWEYV